MDREAWQAIVHGVAERYYWVSNMHTHTHTHTEWNTSPTPWLCGIEETFTSHTYRWGFIQDTLWCRGLPHGSVGKESACNAGDMGSILGSGRSPGEGNGNPFQYSCLENPRDRGACRLSPWLHADPSPALTEHVWGDLCGPRLPAP